jgi:hypothetical protein
MAGSILALHQLDRLGPSIVGGRGWYKAGDRTRKQIGVEHPEMLRSMSNLALVLDQQGIYEKAEKMHRQALEATLVVSP